MKKIEMKNIVTIDIENKVIIVNGKPFDKDTTDRELIHTVERAKRMLNL